MAVNRFDDYVFIDVNHRFIRFTGYSREEIVGRSITELNILSREDYERICQSLKTKGAIYNEEIEYRTKSGNIRMGIYSAELIDVRGEKLLLSIHHDITERVHAQNVLKQKEEELTKRSAELEKANSALRVFLERRREDRKNLETRLQQNINELIIPYIRELQNYNLDERGKCYLNILESNIKDIVSPFLNNISSYYKNLTPTEIKVSSMVRGGMTSKNIAKLLNVAPGTVDTHRNNIRKKLGLEKGKTNLRSYLLSIS
jgi:PAS domain S-box-containing protein